MLILTGAQAARAQVTMPLSVSGNLLIQSGSTSLTYTNATVGAGSAPQTISGSVMIRGGKAFGASCSRGGDCWATDFCEDGVCCCNSPGTTNVNGTPTSTCYASQYPVNSLYGNNNDPGTQFQCSNCAACNTAGKCAPAATSRSTGRTTSTCRPAVIGSDGTTCDLTEVCSGGLACPPDSFATPSTVVSAGWAPGQCRASRGGCDVVGVCPGGTTSCPANQVQPASFVCAGQNTNGVCNGVTHCIGSPTCPPPPPAPNGTPCRAAAGQCDVADRCDGVSTACNNVLIAAGTACDNGVTCNGSSAYCTNSSGVNVGYSGSTSCN